jgi:hypothetical protein
MHSTFNDFKKKMDITAEKYYDDNLENYNLLNKIDPMTIEQLKKLSIGRLVQLFINTKNKPLKPTIMKTNYEKQATLRIKSEVNGEMKHFDIENFDVVKANQLYDHKYSLAIYEEIKKGLSNLFGYEIYSLPVCNISESDFKSDQKFRMAGGYADCLGEGNMNNHQVFFDAELI